MALRQRGWVWLGLSAVVLIIDQLTKFLASQELTLYVPHKVTGFFNLTLLHNKGIAFSILADQPGWQRWFILAMASVIVVWLVLWLLKSPRHLRLQNMSLALVIGGALGNIYDRAVLGYVVDFIQLHYNDYYWPAFNVADSAITLGAVLLIIDTLFRKQDTEKDESTVG